MKCQLCPLILCLLLLPRVLLQSLLAQSAAFTYQGRLRDSGQPANGSYDFQFTLADAPSGGNRVGTAITNAPVGVSNGLFVVVLDFGSGAFDGSSRWLEIGVRTNGSAGPYTLLSPRQAITAAPYATFANTAANAAVAANLTPGAAITANGAGITNLNGASIQAGTISSNQLDQATAAQLALAGTRGRTVSNAIANLNGSGTNTALYNPTLVAGTNAFQPVWSNVPPVLAPGTNFIVSGLPDTNANGVYVASSWYYDEPSGDYITNFAGPEYGIIYDDQIDLYPYQVIITNGAGSNLYYTPVVGWPYPQRPSPFSGPATNTVGAAVAWSTNQLAPGYSYASGFGVSGGALMGSFSGSFSGSLTTNIQGPVATTGGQTGFISPNMLSTIQVNHAMRRSAGRLPLMGATGGALVFSTEDVAISWALRLNTCGFVDAGYNAVLIDAGWASSSRDANGNLQSDPINFPHGIPWLVSVLKTNRCYLGLYSTALPAEGTPVVTSATAYKDGFQLAAWGVRSWKIDGAATFGSSDNIRFALEQAAAGLDNGAAANGLERPVYLTVVFESLSWRNYPWIPTVVNSFYAIDHDFDDTLPDRQWGLMQFLNMATLVSPGCQANPEGLGHASGSSWWNTNYARMDLGVFCMGPFPLWLADPWDVAGYIYTNREAININQDPLVVPGLFLNTNTLYGTNYDLQKVLYRPLASGDIALGCWNLNTNNTSLFTINLARVPGLSTNTATVLDVFGQSASSVSGTLNALVNAGGFNLYRLRR